MADRGGSEIERTVEGIVRVHERDPCGPEPAGVAVR